ncbi:hypothetical protein VTH06DRAFT_4200 [Thermothelomyces fergusii]
MAAMPIQAPSRGGYGGRDASTSPGPLPPISTGHGETLPRPFGPPSRTIPFPSNLSPSAASAPIQIRGMERNDVPPPLPPPRLVPIDGPVDPNLYLKESMRRHEYGSSETDSLGHSFRRPNLSFKSDISDDGYHSLDSLSTRSCGLPSPFGHHTLQSYRPNGDAIDHSMLDKLNRSAPFKPHRPGLSASVNDLPSSRPHHTQPTTLSLPHRTRQPFGDASFARSPLSVSATSPIGGTPFGYNNNGRAPADQRSPLGAAGSDYDHSPLSRFGRGLAGSAADDGPGAGYYDAREDDTDFPMEETTRMRTLAIEDQWRDRDWDKDRERERERDYYQHGQKRRASSPPSDDSAPPNDALRRRDGSLLLSRGSPAPRLLAIPQNSISSVSSASRSGSLVSNLTASSGTSAGSFGRRSPNALSPAGLSPTDPPRPACEQPLPPQVTRAVASPRKLTEIPKSHGSLAAKLKGPYMCECCPKKPKKFETEEDLRAHEAEKQYGCSFCGNRFKNKNEAERHQNSLHVRRHSWSCSALTSYERAFHDSTTRPGEADVCGYCGEEFPRTGQSPGGLTASEQDWDDRIRHLQDVHKFRECNASKKFYRADHFRQHLKHSHAGTSGKWTNMLENACMMEEEPPAPTR